MTTNNFKIVKESVWEDRIFISKNQHLYAMHLLRPDTYIYEKKFYIWNSKARYWESFDLIKICAILKKEGISDQLLNEFLKGELQMTANKIKTGKYFKNYHNEKNVYGSKGWYYLEDLYDDEYFRGPAASLYHDGIAYGQTLWDVEDNCRGWYIRKENYSTSWSQVDLIKFCAYIKKKHCPDNVLNDFIEVTTYNDKHEKNDAYI